MPYPKRGARRQGPPPPPPEPEPEPHAERVRPRDPFLRFFQDCVIACASDPGEEFELESFLDRKAAEFNVPQTEIRPVRRIAKYVARTPLALVEVRRPVGIDPEDGATLEGTFAFVVPAFGDFIEVTKERLLDEGYELRFTSEGEVGERLGLAVEHPETEVIITIRTYDMVPLAQGPVGFIEAVGAYSDALAQEAAVAAEGGSPGRDAT